MTTKIKECPILFSGDMVRAILDGRKTQTRRIINKAKGYKSLSEFQPSDTPGYDFTFRRPDLCWCDYSLQDLLKLCPYGERGDRLWVRESFKEVCKGDIIGTSPGLITHGYYYEADKTTVWGNPCKTSVVDNETIIDAGKIGKLKPSIFMPKGACRIMLEITDVR
jgi:hypothetical protein